MRNTRLAKYVITFGLGHPKVLRAYLRLHTAYQSRMSGTDAAVGSVRKQSKTSGLTKAYSDSYKDKRNGREVI
jgi:hypothetical protein